MGSGYVLDFNNTTFGGFVADSVGKDIFDEKYSYRTGSKANRLRRFWVVEPNHVVGKLLADLIAFAESHGSASIAPTSEECHRIAERLKQGAPVPDIDAITTDHEDRDFHTLAKSIRQAIDSNQPASGLDSLHTYVVRYVRSLCEKHGIEVIRDKPLHSLFGQYLKQLKAEGHIESEMTERILKVTISVLDSFNNVRNERSFAHDNPILNHSESLLIFNFITAFIRFVDSIGRATFFL